ncbi:hypothetical protein [Pseudomonas sp. TMW22091]|uniref:hypothetical protein n=1 Tax=Pseudomonas sp. TMW22091 TaxID=2506435 RepID=UPI001F0F80EC|nr:hypothetical protein [Pseudomonas sp. TMW22091]
MLAMMILGSEIAPAEKVGGALLREQDESQPFSASHPVVAATAATGESQAS